jgi:ABC-type iron transport system FetAB permease component
MIERRIAIFLFGCIGVRCILAIIAKKININYLPILGYLALLPAIGFIYIYITGSRKTGLEVGNGKIWWNDLRPIHSLLYFLFAYNAIIKNNKAWVYLMVDICIGLIAFYLQINK